MTRFNRAITAAPVMAAAFSVLAIAPALAQPASVTTYATPSGNSTVVVTQPAPPQAVLVTPAAPATAVIPPAPDGTASVIVSPSAPPSASVVTLPSVPQSTTTVITQSPATVTPAMAATPFTPPASPPPNEVMTAEAAQAAGMVWMPSRWEYRGTIRTFVPGQYVPQTQTGSIWVPGSWEQQSSNDPFVWVAGHWS
jgi:hypothetical protein